MREQGKSHVCDGNQDCYCDQFDEGEPITEGKLALLIEQEENKALETLKILRREDRASLQNPRK